VTQAPVTSFGDTLLAINGTAPPWRAYQPTIAQHGDGIEVLIPPRSTAVPGGDLDPPTRRDRHLAMITEQRRMARQVATGYGQRSLAETTMGRYKTRIGPRLRARGFAAQQTEAAVGVAVLNRMLTPGRPIPSVASQTSHRRLGFGAISPLVCRVRQRPAIAHQPAS
jgi:hypothetical protein